MADINAINSKLWDRVKKLCGNMDASEYKNYVLAFMFYRYLSEHQEQRLVSSGLISPTEGQSINDAYAEEATGEDLSEYLKNLSEELGYAIAPADTWASLVEKITNSSVLPSDYQTMFDNFNKNAAMNKDSEQDFKGVFNDVNLGDTRLGSTTNDRARSLSKIVELVDSVDYYSEDGKDILGAIYEYLIGQFAVLAGKKGGEFYTPHEISRILAKIVTSGLEESDNTFTVYEIKTQNWIQFNDCPLRGVA